MDNWFTDGVGILGMVLVVLAYYLLQLEKVDPKSLPYTIINLVGSLCLIFSLLFAFNLASFLLNIFWVGASLIGLWKIWQRRRPA